MHYTKTATSNYLVAAAIFLLLWAVATCAIRMVGWLYVPDNSYIPVAWPIVVGGVVAAFFFWKLIRKVED